MKMRQNDTLSRRSGPLMIGATWLLLSLALAGAGRAQAETAEEIEARMAETEARIEQRGAEMDAIAEEIEAHATVAEARDREVETRLEEAQVRLEEAAREVAELSARLSGDAIELAMRSLDMRRVMLGINIGTTPESGNDGVYVMGVTPDGPADRAGIQAGDIITRIDGIDLTGGEPGDGIERMTARMKDVSAGDELALTVRRGEADVDFVVAPEEMSPLVMAFEHGAENLQFDLGDLEELEMLKHLDIHGGPDEGYAIRFGPAGRWGDMELVTLTPDLGDYFGAAEGLLVVRAPRDADLGLKDGDVILAIDGRRPSDPAHAMRILRSYEPGERLGLDIIRQQQRQSVEIVLPTAEVSAVAPAQSPPTLDLGDPEAV
jgi:C-terminal processing protease CtpA/Prc